MQFADGAAKYEIDGGEMLPSDVTGIDLIDELQLRYWARTNYVPVEARDAELHPIVMDEMRRRDLELQETRATASHEVARDS